MKIVNKTLWVFVATITFMVAALEATPTKTGGFGLYNPATNFNESWMIDGQLPYIDINPASMGALNPQLYGDTDGANQNEGGIMFKPVSNLFVGVFIGKPAYTSHLNAISGDFSPYYTILGTINPAGSFMVADPVLGTNNAPALNTRNISAIFQMSMGNMNLGLGLNYARTSRFIETIITLPASTNTSSKINSNLGIVLGADIKTGNMNIDASVAYKNSGINNSVKLAASKEEITLADKGLKDLNADVRISTKLGGNNLLHGAIGFSLTGGSAEYKYTNTTAGALVKNATLTSDSGGMDIKLGVSDEMRIDEKLMSFFGLVYNRTSKTIANITGTINGTTTPAAGNSSSTDTIGNVVTLILGLEANLSENWMGRFGIGSNIWNNTPKTITTTKTTASTTTVTDSTFNDAGSNIAFGLSYKLSNFSLDWNINKALLVNGPNFIGGTMPGMAASFGVNYAFDKK